MPSGNPAPTVRAQNWMHAAYRPVIEYGGEELADFAEVRPAEGEDSFVISIKALSTAFNGGLEYPYVVVASNKHGSSELTIPYSSRGCGYSQSDLIRQWIGTHTLPLAPPGYTPNGRHCDSSDRSCRSFMGSSQVTFTASAIVVNGEPAKYLDRRVYGRTTWCDRLYARSEDGSINYTMDSWQSGGVYYDYEMDSWQGGVYANLRTGGGINCGDRQVLRPSGKIEKERMWYQARIYASSTNTDYPSRDYARLRHSSCTYP